MTKYIVNFILKMKVINQSLLDILVWNQAPLSLTSEFWNVVSIVYSVIWKKNGISFVDHRKSLQKKKEELAYTLYTLVLVET